MLGYHAAVPLRGTGALAFPALAADPCICAVSPPCPQMAADKGGAWGTRGLGSQLSAQ